ncbi:MAG: hypothetical protein IKH07_02820 [Oscillospiraceae bacterium]|nr:hypothetical protein [Oscillospiraceae bacterium]
MKSGELAAAIVVLALAAVLLVLGILHFLERDPLLNNAWIRASKEERAAPEKGSKRDRREQG